MTTITASPSRTDSRWPDRLAPLAAGWLGLWGVLALIGTLTGAGYPFGPNDPHGGDVSLLRLMPVEVATPLFAGVLLTAAVAALAMSRPAARPPGPLRALLAGYGWAVAFVLVLVVPDVRVLVVLGYLPILIVGAPFGWPPVDYADIFNWALFARFAALAGGLLLAGAVLAWQRRTAAACVGCGRNHTDRGWTTPAAATRWGRWAAGIAAVIPFTYALTRFAWAAGIPLGISREFLTEMQDSGLVWAGFGLAAFATVGAILTLGLVQRWGERFPRWMIGVAGRRVPVKLAVVPATLVAISVTAASLGLLSNPKFWELTGGLSITGAPMLLWPVWGVALGVATYAYHLRRRGACRRCGRG
ncbi:hypothetical protein GAR05_04576 [Micromonospora saelicesensis]|uniref:Uncharacterized protein n=1 Tax=Micromonospora saelicesensis TaxID=285676 RepID=A0ABX9CED5_9ACTN|nr:hypothetical protein [Micromonospora saelicesensis]RAN95311.1 hypothetical protein GAR05_04576 [Micromonospora saelicesensis]